MWTDVILVASGVAFGAICFFVGYGIAKKRKIQAQVLAEIERLKGELKGAANKL